MILYPAVGVILIFGVVALLLVVAWFFGYYDDE
jgi:hypothetical protein